MSTFARFRAALAACGLVVAQAVAQSPADDAQKQLELGESRAREGRFADARAVYARLEAKYPETPAGIEGALRAKPSAYLGWSDILRHGPSKNRIDVVLLGEGYELSHMDAFVDLAADVPATFEREPVFREYFSYFNFLRADLVSAEAGVDGHGREYDTALGGHMIRGDSGSVDIDRKPLHAALARIPDADGEALVFVMNGQFSTASVGLATVAGRTPWAILHTFGHSFGRLSDERDDEVPYTDAIEPFDGVNASSLDDEKRVPWAHWIAAKVPGVGVYQGARGQQRGAWRPTASGCLMAGASHYCVVCREALVLEIYARVDPIESETPTAAAPGAPPGAKEDAREFLKLEREPLTLTVVVMQPASHALEVRWWVLPDEPSTAGGKASISAPPSARNSAPDRTLRGPLPTLTAPPRSISRSNSSGAHKFVVSRKDLEPGRYRVVCRVKDTTELRGEKFPWVLKDERGLLESERTWWLEVGAAH